MPSAAMIENAGSPLATAMPAPNAFRSMIVFVVVGIVDRAPRPPSAQRTSGLNPCASACMPPAQRDLPSADQATLERSNVPPTRPEVSGAKSSFRSFAESTLTAIVWYPTASRAPSGEKLHTVGLLAVRRLFLGDPAKLRIVEANQAVLGCRRQPPVRCEGDAVDIALVLPVGEPLLPVGGAPDADAVVTPQPGGEVLAVRREREIMNDIFQTAQPAGDLPALPVEQVDRTPRLQSDCSSLRPRPSCHPG